jgi:hypothetical protein
MPVELLPVFDPIEVVPLGVTLLDSRTVSREERAAASDEMASLLATRIMSKRRPDVIPCRQLSGRELIDSGFDDSLPLVRFVIRRGRERAGGLLLHDITIERDDTRGIVARATPVPYMTTRAIVSEFKILLDWPLDHPLGLEGGRAFSLSGYNLPTATGRRWHDDGAAAEARVEPELRNTTRALVEALAADRIDVERDGDGVPIKIGARRRPDGRR